MNYITNMDTTDIQPTLILINNFYIDFNALARHNHELYQHLVILDYKTTINFKRQDSLIILTKSIMSQLFNISWDCPIHNLCPRVPNRMNYLLWLNHYLLTKQGRVKEKINIIDIGTGATCIYPLLGVRIFRNWSFIGLESNETSAKYAQKLVDLNKLNDRIKIIQSGPKKYLQGVIDKDVVAEFCICNPPFFQIQSNYQPVGQMLQNQYETEGGEYEFFFEIFRQSFGFNNISWFTCMMGTKKGYYDARAFLAGEKGATLNQYALGQIKQGNISRYILAWQPRRN